MNKDNQDKKYYMKPGFNSISHNSDGNQIREI